MRPWPSILLPSLLMAWPPLSIAHFVPSSSVTMLTAFGGNPQDGAAGSSERSGNAASERALRTGGAERSLCGATSVCA